jgi:hypothetical protein
MAIKIYLFPVYLLGGLISPTKSSPHFINGSFGRRDQLCKTLHCQSSYFLTCIIRLVIIMDISIHSWPPISNIQYLPLCYFSCKMPSSSSFMQFFHHHICFCCCQTSSQFVVSAHSIPFTIL